MTQDTQTPNAETPTTESTPAPTATASPAQGVTLEDFEKFKNTVFATLRRDGQVGSKKPTKTPAATSGDGVVPPADMRALDRALNRSGHAQRLDDAAYRRIERAYADESPDDPGSWVESYFGGFGIGASSTTATSPATTTAAPSAVPTATQPKTPPASDRGAPQAPRVPLEEQDLVTMSDTDRNALIKQKGNAWFTKALMSQLKGRSVRR